MNPVEYLTEEEKRELFLLLCLELKSLGLFDRFLNYGVKLYMQKIDTAERLPDIG
jgi:hypothetical protein